MLGMRNGTSQSPFRPALGRLLVMTRTLRSGATASALRAYAKAPTPNGSTVCRIRLHLAFAGSGTYDPFATAASRSRLHLPRTTRLALPWRAALEFFHAPHQLSLKLRSGRDLAAVEPHFDTRHGVASFVSSLRREGIVAVGVALTNAAVLAMDEYFAALAHGGLTRGRDGLTLSVVDRSCAAIPCTLHGPTALMRNNMPILLRGCLKRQFPSRAGERSPFLTFAGA